MWKRLNLEQFLKKYNQDSESLKTGEKIKHHLSNTQDYSESKVDKSNLNSSLKRCNYCQNQISSKDFEKHINQNCKKISNRFNTTNDSDSLRRKKIDRIVNAYNNTGRIKPFTNNKQIQISIIAEKLNKPVGIIVNLLRNIGLDISNEYDYVDKIFAESVWLVFHPETKNIPSFEVNPNSKDSEPEVPKNLTQIKKKSKTLDEIIRKVDKSYRLCPYCSCKLSIVNYDLHILQKCPKRNKDVPTPSLEKQETQSSNHISNDHKDIDNLKNVSNDKIKIEKIHWELLPQGEWHFAELQNHFRRLSSTRKWKNKHFDEARIHKIEKKLKPAKCFIGKDEFDGYVVYCFSWTQNVILECPIYGNAIYIIKKGKSSWQEIAKATKWEARTKYSSQVKVINHNDTWLERLEQNLRYNF